MPIRAPRQGDRSNQSVTAGALHFCADHFLRMYGNVARYFSARVRKRGARSNCTPFWHWRPGVFLRTFLDFLGDFFSYQFLRIQRPRRSCRSRGRQLSRTDAPRACSRRATFDDHLVGDFTRGDTQGAGGTKSTSVSVVFGVGINQSFEEEVAEFFVMDNFIFWLVSFSIRFYPSCQSVYLTAINQTIYIGV